MGGGRYTPIGLGGGYNGGRDCFAAKFDGDGHEIKLTINVGAYAGVFGYVGESGEICKLGVAKGSYISASGSMAGGIAGWAYTIRNCTNAGEVSVSNDGSAGGIAGGAHTIRNCTNAGEVSVSNDGSAGGIAGNANGAISDCTNTGAVTATGSDNGSAGGIVGSAFGTIRDCTNSGAVIATSARYRSNAGGIAGMASTIRDCINSGAVTATGSGRSNAGGIAGGIFSSWDGITTISDCTNSGEVSGRSNAGGIAGGIFSSWDGTTTISDCTNSGEVSGSSNVGGIAGDVFSSWGSTTTIRDCTNSGVVSTTADGDKENISFAGGIAGWAGMGATITGCHNDGNGTVSASGRNNAGWSNSSAGGIVGYAEAGATVSGCSNAGEVKASAGSSAGGIAGFASGTISNCPNNGVVSASDGGLAGGIAGQVSGAISDCNNAGKVTASDGGSAGGIAGKAEAGATVRNCINSGEVGASNDGFAGGIVGEASPDSSFYGPVTISDSYNVGAVTAGDDGHAGGIAGRADGKTISGCYYLQKDADNPNGTKSGVGDDGKAKVAKVARARSRSIAAYADEDTGGEAQCLGIKLEDAKGEKLASDLSGSSKEFEKKWEEETIEVVRNSEYGAGVETLGDAQSGLAEEMKKADEEKNDDKKEEVQGLLGKVYSVIEVRNSNPERKDAFAHVVNELVANWWKLELKEKKERFPAEVEKIKAEVTKLGQIHGVSVGKELEKLDKINEEAGDAVTNEQIDGKMRKALEVLAEFLDSIQDKEKNIGHASSGVGGQAGFYKAKNGVVTFRVKPNPGYKVSEIITSGGTKIKPGAVVKTLPERVTVRFEKV